MKPISAAMLSVNGLLLSDAEKYLLEKSNPLGVTLFKRNIESPEQVQSLTSSIREAIGRDNVLIATDQEGGRVCRFDSPFQVPFAAQRAIGSLNIIQAREMVVLLARLMGQVLLRAGVNLNYAPCLDVAYPQTGAVLKTRCFSENPQMVATLGKETLQAYMRQGIIPCVKHLPGHGRAAVDPHLNLPIISVSLDELQKDAYPFAQTAKLAPMGMTAHILIPSLDDCCPITQSVTGIRYIRDEIGFKGFLISDAIDMKALKGSLAEKTKLSLKAGCDAVCYCAGQTDGLEEVIDAALFLSDAALDRYAKMCSVLKNREEETSNISRYQELFRQLPNLIEDYDAVEVLHRLSQPS